MKDFTDDTKSYFEEIEDYEEKLEELDDYEELDEFDEEFEEECEEDFQDKELEDPKVLQEEVHEELKDFDSTPNNNKTPKKEFDKEKYAREKQKERDDCYVMIEDFLISIANGDSQKLESLLKVMAQFETYSLNNCILIAEQLPKAKHVRAYSDWKDKNINVLRGSKKIKVLAPKKQEYDGEERVFINVKNVYDESQTDIEKKSIKPRISDSSIYKGLEDVTEKRIVKVDSEDIGYRTIDQDFKTIFVKASQPSHLLNITTLNAILEATTLENSPETENNTRIISNFDNFINECINFVFANRYYQNSTFSEFFIVKVNFEKLDLSPEILKEALKKVRYITKRIFQAVYNEEKLDRKLSNDQRSDEEPSNRHFSE